VARSGATRNSAGSPITRRTSTRARPSPPRTTAGLQLREVCGAPAGESGRPAPSSTGSTTISSRSSAPISANEWIVAGPPTRCTSPGKSASCITRTSAVGSEPATRCEGVPSGSGRVVRTNTCRSGPRPTVGAERGLERRAAHHNRTTVANELGIPTRGARREPWRAQDRGRPSEAATCPSTPTPMWVRILIARSPFVVGSSRNPYYAATATVRTVDGN
jgi:hypothetical protein